MTRSGPDCISRSEVPPPLAPNFSEETAAQPRCGGTIRTRGWRETPGVSAVCAGQPTFDAVGEVLSSFSWSPAGRAALRDLAQRLAPQVFEVAKREMGSAGREGFFLKFTQKDKSGRRHPVYSDRLVEHLDLVGVLGGRDVTTFRRLLGIVEGESNTTALAAAVLDLGPPGRQALIEALADGSTEQRRRALEVVEHLRSQAVTKALLRAVEKCCTDGNAAIRATAVTVYAQLARRSLSRS